MQQCFVVLAVALGLGLTARATHAGPVFNVLAPFLDKGRSSNVLGLDNASRSHDVAPPADFGPPGDLAPSNNLAASDRQNCARGIGEDGDADIASADVGNQPDRPNPGYGNLQATGEPVTGDGAEDSTPTAAGLAALSTDTRVGCLSHGEAPVTKRAPDIDAITIDRNVTTVVMENEGTDAIGAAPAVRGLLASLPMVSLASGGGGLEFAPSGGFGGDAFGTANPDSAGLPPTSLDARNLSAQDVDGTGLWDAFQFAGDTASSGSMGGLTASLVSGSNDADSMLIPDDVAAMYIRHARQFPIDSPDSFVVTGTLSDFLPDRTTVEAVGTALLGMLVVTYLLRRG